MDKKILKLAGDIARMGREISRDNICKDYKIGYGRNVISVISDSGYEAIHIGDKMCPNNDGYMCLYTNNTEKRNSFPSAREIAKLLEVVANNEKLPEGEGKAAYHDWKEFGGMEKQLKYFSSVVKTLAGL